MDGEQQGIAVQIVAGGDKALGQDDRVLIVEGEVAVALAVEVGDDVVGLACHLDGCDGLLHVDVDGAAGAEFVDEAYLELLWPDDSAVVGVALGDDDVVVLVGSVDSWHALLLDPHVAELPDMGLGGCRVEDCHEFVPRGIAEEMAVQVLL